MNARPDWMTQAACRGHWELFDAERGDRSKAVAMCLGCPVRAQCADHAEAVSDKVGVWAGRVQSPTADKPPARPHRGPRPIFHGTRGGYLAHRRRNERPCDVCAKAMEESRLAAETTEHRVERTRAMTLVGATTVDIARELGVSLRSVNRCYRRAAFEVAS